MKKILILTVLIGFYSFAENHNKDDEAQLNKSIGYLARYHYMHMEKMHSSHKAMTLGAVVDTYHETIETMNEALRVDYLFTSDVSFHMLGESEILTFYALIANCCGVAYEENLKNRLQQPIDTLSLDFNKKLVLIEGMNKQKRSGKEITYMAEQSKENPYRLPVQYIVVKKPVLDEALGHMIRFQLKVRIDHPMDWQAMVISEAEQVFMDLCHAFNEDELVEWMFIIDMIVDMDMMNTQQMYSTTIQPCCHDAYGKKIKALLNAKHSYFDKHVLEKSLQALQNELD